jgi:hypothetical protein
MFETDDFKKQLEGAVASEADYRGLKEYEDSIIDYLQRLASENERPLMLKEMRKAASARRGIPDAVNSARILVRRASRYAAAEKRTVLTQSDVEKAYRAKFCRVWPFCKTVRWYG